MVMTNELRMRGKIFEIAVRSLEAKKRERDVRWREACASERHVKAEREKRVALVEEYLELCDTLAEETSGFEPERRRWYIWSVLRGMRD
jgi:hypothetical protein